MEYNPDKWLLVRITNKDGKVYEKVFGTWSGGYLGEDRWRMNSGIERVTEDDDFYYVHGSSGSVYKCHKKMYGATAWGTSVVNAFLNSSDYDVEVIEDYVSYVESKLLQEQE